MVMTVRVMTVRMMAVWMMRVSVAAAGFYPKPAAVAAIVLLKLPKIWLVKAIVVVEAVAPKVVAIAIARLGRILPYTPRSQLSVTGPKSGTAERQGPTPKTNTRHTRQNRSKGTPKARSPVKTQASGPEAGARRPIRSKASTLRRRPRGQGPRGSDRHRNHAQQSGPDPSSAAVAGRHVHRVHPEAPQRRGRGGADAGPSPETQRRPASGAGWPP